MFLTFFPKHIFGKNWIIDLKSPQIKQFDDVFDVLRRNGRGGGHADSSTCRWIIFYMFYVFKYFSEHISGKNLIIGRKCLKFSNFVMYLILFAGGGWKNMQNLENLSPNDPLFKFLTFFPMHKSGNHNWIIRLKCHQVSITWWLCCLREEGAKSVEDREIDLS